MPLSLDDFKKADNKDSSKDNEPKNYFGAVLWLCIGAILFFSAVPNLRAHHFGSETLLYAFIGIICLYVGFKKL
jgi:hypothetical protein